MVVTLTLGQLANDVRISVSDNDSDIPPFNAPLLQRGLDTATALIEQRAPDAPDGIQNAAVSMLVGYWFEHEPADDRRLRSAWYVSGAGETLSPWIERRAEAV